MSEDDLFRSRFEAQSIPRPEWTHRAHLRIAYSFLIRYPYAEAVDRMRAGVKALNAANGVVDTPTGGYHETITCAFMQVMHTMIRQFGPGESSEAFLDAQTQLGSKRILLLFYSRELIMSAGAKAGFVAPDLAPLPVAVR